MKLEIVEITPESQPNDPEVRERATTSSKSRCTKHFLIRKDKVEVGFLSIDTIPEVEYLVVYEIFVPRALRKRGVGSEILREAENIGRQLGYKRVNLTPCPLEFGYSPQELIAWYKSRGYRTRRECQTELEKLIAPRAE